MEVYQRVMKNDCSHEIGLCIVVCHDSHKRSITFEYIVMIDDCGIYSDENLEQSIPPNHPVIMDDHGTRY